MVEPQKDKFWKALVLTVVVFLLGVTLGYYLEAGRIDKVQKEINELVISWDDARTQAAYYENIDPKYCDRAIEENFKFGDRIYEYGRTLEQYEDSNRLTDELKIEKQKYTLLKLQFFINSKNIKEKCNADYKFVLYFYQDEPENLEIKSQQVVIARVLGDLKQEKGSEIILIPLAGDFDLGVINLLKETYNVKEYPSVVVDGVVLTGNVKLEDLEALL